MSEKPEPSTDRVDQFERILDTLDEQRANQSLDEWIALLQKVKAEVDTRLASATRWKKGP